MYNFQILITQIAWQGHAGAALDAANGFTVVDCDACRFTNSYGYTNRYGYGNINSYSDLNADGHSHSNPWK